MPDDEFPLGEDLRAPRQRIVDARTKTVNLIFDRVGVPVKLWREVELGYTDNYGKDEETKALVATELGIMYYPGTSPGGARPDRVEERYGERVYWEPHIYLRADSQVLEKDIIEMPMKRYPENPNADKQLWEAETIVPFNNYTHVQLQRFIEQ